MEWYITSYGTRHAALRLEGIGTAASNPREAFEEIYLTVLDIEAETFDLEGARRHPRWAEITVTHMTRKARRGQSTMIGQMTGNMRESLTTYRHPMQNVRIERTRLVFGSKFDYSKWFNSGWRAPVKPYKVRGKRTPVRRHEQPGRPLLRLTQLDADAFGKEIMRHLLRDRTAGTIGGA